MRSLSRSTPSLGTIFSPSWGRIFGAVAAPTPLRTRRSGADDDAVGKTPLSVVGAAIVREGRCLVAQRREEGSFPRMWEFPGGKIEVGETPAAALVREIREELGVEIEVLDFAGRGRSETRSHFIELDVYFARLLAGEPVTHAHLEFRWVDAAELGEFEYAPADVPLLPIVRARLLQHSPGSQIAPSSTAASG